MAATVPAAAAKLPLLGHMNNTKTVQAANVTSSTVPVLPPINALPTNVTSAAGTDNIAAVAAQLATLPNYITYTQSHNSTNAFISALYNALTVISNLMSDSLKSNGAPVVEAVPLDETGNISVDGSNSNISFMSAGRRPQKRQSRHFEALRNVSIQVMQQNEAMARMTALLGAHTSLVDLYDALKRDLHTWSISGNEMRDGQSDSDALRKGSIGVLLASDQIGDLDMNANDSKHVFERLVGDLHRFVELAKLWGTDDPQGKSKSQTDLDLAQTVTQSIGTKQDANGGKGESGKKLKKARSSASLHGGNSNEHLPGKHASMAADRAAVFDFVMGRSAGGNNDGSNGNNGDRALAGRKPIRVIMADLHRKIDFLKANPGALELFQDRIQKLKQQLKMENQSKTNIIRSNRIYVVQAYRPETRAQIRAERIAAAQEHRESILESHRMQSRNLTLQRAQAFKQREDLLGMGQSLRREKEETDRLALQQRKWGILTVVASRLQLIHTKLEAEHIQWQEEKRLFFAARIIQRAWNRHIRAQRVNRQSDAWAVITRALRQFTRKFLEHKRQLAANILHEFLQEISGMSKMMKLIKNFRLAVIKAQQCARRVLQRAYYQRMLISMQWESYEIKMWEERTNALMGSDKKAVTKATKGKQKGATTQTAPNAVSDKEREFKAKIISNMERPKGYTDEIKNELIVEDLRARKRKHRRLLVAWEREIAKYDEMIRQKNLLNAAAIKQATLMSSSTEVPSGSVAAPNIMVISADGNANGSQAAPVIIEHVGGMSRASSTINNSGLGLASMLPKNEGNAFLGKNLAVPEAGQALRRRSSAIAGENAENTSGSQLAPPPGALRRRNSVLAMADESAPLPPPKPTFKLLLDEDHLKELIAEATKRHAQQKMAQKTEDAVNEVPSIVTPVAE